MRLVAACCAMQHLDCRPSERNTAAFCSTKVAWCAAGKHEKRQLWSADALRLNVQRPPLHLFNIDRRSGRFRSMNPGDRSKEGPRDDGTSYVPNMLSNGPGYASSIPNGAPKEKEGQKPQLIDIRMASCICFGIMYRSCFVVDNLSRSATRRLLPPRIQSQ